MRAIAIMSRVLKELFRDKRTLALMFIAPILIMVLMSIIFNTNSSTDVNIGTVGITKTLNNDINGTKHVSAKKYNNNSIAKKALKNDKIDAIINKKGNEYHLTYANTDSTKTATVKLAFKNALIVTNIDQLKNALKQSTEATMKLKAQLREKQNQSAASPVADENSVINSSKQGTPKIVNTYIYGDKNTGYFAKMLPILMGFFVFFFVFLISGMALLKERTTGTLDRLLATPVRRSSIVFGYMLSYGILAIIQTIVIVITTVWLLGMEVVGSIAAVVFINLMLALVALAAGILLSTFANSEFQMMQFIPLIVVPQIFFSGLISLDSMPNWIRIISYIIPLKYSGDAVNLIIMKGTPLMDLFFDISILLVFLVVLTILNIEGLKRYRKV
ncbi:ABC transporter permease [Liquorilactobacillus capillatus]|uniref:ABC-type multidrug transport system, permease component n=1 Tax=Liquorilactobacillus capillatus DSM 19910 TaxID=1423731 RepID=A0A0R1LZK6_9LACO|nr:ABC transporter permease [Liquorilactobacillus capillatus]KRL00928.1 ABC-type multidrug transport system, permease component [Liquorilactobacillus capillatus DSM 19910]